MISDAFTFMCAIYEKSPDISLLESPTTKTDNFAIKKTNPCFAIGKQGLLVIGNFNFSRDENILNNVIANMLHLWDVGEQSLSVNIKAHWLPAGKGRPHLKK